MKSVYFLFFLWLLAAPTLIKAQQPCWVYFTDKKGISFEPKKYFDPKAIERRELQGIPLNDPTDWPLNEQYVSGVASITDSTLFSSRWFNAVAVYATDDQLDRISRLPYVSEIEKVELLTSAVASLNDFDTTLSEDNEEILKNQIKSLQGDLFIKAGINGKGVRIAIFDVGFPGSRENPAFAQIISEGRLIATHDFTKRKGDNVFWGKSHGTNVWSCIAGKVGDKQIGLATGAEFLLAKTEVNREPFSEELHWLAAAEWADKNGADIINSSLGYTKDRYFPWSMDGKTSFVARAANMAARKGMLVVNAAGNEGTDSWHVIGTPADADSVLSIGGINPETGIHTGFSSYGPTADKRMKPNVCAYGHVVVSGSGGLVTSQGTSFASPLVAGFAACVLQVNKGMKNMVLFHEIEKSGSLFPYFDYAHGFGVPQAAYFVSRDKKFIEPTFTIVETTDSVNIVVRKDLIRKADETAEDSHDNDLIGEKYLYYNIMNSKGVLDSYYVVKVSEPNVVNLMRSNYTSGETLNVHYQGYTLSYKF
ncbi:MAG: S8 family serine peptidase [Bacteroidetes bacterium]|nr:S8 family serine peptidase [Bacteroidota bacterium]